MLILWFGIIIMFFYAPKFWILTWLIVELLGDLWFARLQYRIHLIKPYENKLVKIFFKKVF